MLRGLSTRVVSFGRQTVHRSAGCRDQGIAQEQRSFGGHQLARLHPFENLPVSVALHADLDGAPGKAAAVGRDPRRHRAVAFSHHAIEGDRDRAHRRAGADGEIGEHAGPQLVVRIGDLGSHQHPTRRRIDDRPDCGDLPVEDPARKGVDRHFDLLSDAEGRTVGFNHVGDHPHRRNIGDRIGRWGVARLHV